MTALWVICIMLLADGPGVPVVRADESPFSLGLAPTSILPASSFETDLFLNELFAPDPFAWYGEASLVFFQRHASSINFGTHLGAVQDQGNGSYLDLSRGDNRSISTSDLDLGTQTGLRFLVGRTIWSDPCDDRGCVSKSCDMPATMRTLSVELGYLAILQQQSSTRAAASPASPAGTITSRFAQTGGDGQFTPILWPFDFANVASLTYRSRFDSAELNLRYSTAASHRMPVDVLAGIRYMKLQENLDYYASNNNPPPALMNLPTTGAYSTRTDNDLIGLQLGSDLSYRLTSNWSLLGRGRGGVLVNAASQRSNLNGTLLSSNLPYNDTGSASGVGFAGLFEFGLHTNFKVTSNLSLMVGYQGLYLSELSTAPRQFQWNTDVNGRNNLDRSGSLFFFGPAAGIEWKW